MYTVPNMRASHYMKGRSASERKRIYKCLHGHFIALSCLISSYYSQHFSFYFVALFLSHFLTESVYISRSQPLVSDYILFVGLLLLSVAADYDSFLPQTRYDLPIKLPQNNGSYWMKQEWNDGYKL